MARRGPRPGLQAPLYQRRGPATVTSCHRVSVPSPSTSRLSRTMSLVRGRANSAQSGSNWTASRRRNAIRSAGMFRNTVSRNQTASTAPTSQLTIGRPARRGTGGLRQHRLASPHALSSYRQQHRDVLVDKDAPATWRAIRASHWDRGEDLACLRQEWPPHLRWLRLVAGARPPGPGRRLGTRGRRPRPHAGRLDGSGPAVVVPRDESEGQAVHGWPDRLDLGGQDFLIAAHRSAGDRLPAVAQLPRHGARRGRARGPVKEQPWDDEGGAFVLHNRYPPPGRYGRCLHGYFSPAADSAGPARAVGRKGRRDAGTR